MVFIAAEPTARISIVLCPVSALATFGRGPFAAMSFAGASHDALRAGIAPAFGPAFGGESSARADEVANDVAARPRRPAKRTRPAQPKARRERSLGQVRSSNGCAIHLPKQSTP